MTEVGSLGGASPSNAQATGPQYGAGLNVDRCNCPLIEKEDQYQVVNNWTKILGNHALKFGADLRYARNLRVPSDNDRTGILYFSNNYTSNPSNANLATPIPIGGLGFATFALGQVTNFLRYVSTSTNAKEFQKRDFFYAQDTWRASPKLTVNYGLRYEFYFPETINAPGNGALLNPDTGYLYVAGVGGVGQQHELGQDHQHVESTNRNSLPGASGDGHSSRLWAQLRHRRIRFDLWTRCDPESSGSLQPAGDTDRRSK